MSLYLKYNGKILGGVGGSKIPEPPADNKVYGRVLKEGETKGQWDVLEVPTVNVGTVTTLPAGSEANVVNVGNEHNAILNFEIPIGNTGIQGLTGLPCNLTIGSVTTGAAGTNAVVTITGEPPNQVLHITVPRGATGATGAKGDPGQKGDTGATGATGPPGNPVSTSSGNILTNYNGAYISAATLQGYCMSKPAVLAVLRNSGTGSNGRIQLPSGGRWAWYFWALNVNPDGVSLSGDAEAGESAGGTVIYSGTRNSCSGWAWKIS